MGGGEDHSPICSQLTNQEGDGRSGNHSGKQDIGTDRSKSCNQSGFQHGAGSAGVTADHKFWAWATVTTQKESRGPAEPEGDLRRDGILVGPAPDSVRAEEFSFRHGFTF
jgi:hypothetical protein